MPEDSVGLGEWMLKARILTAVPLALILLAIIGFAPPVVFAGLVGIIALLGAWEWAALGGLQGRAGRAVYTALLLACLAAVFLLPSVVNNVILAAASVSWTLLFVYVVWRGRSSSMQGLPSGVRLSLGIPILVSAWLALTGVHNLGPDGPLWLLVLFSLVWGADIGAYFVGRRFGRHKLAPLISPGKTWEGVLGGIVTALLGMGLVIMVGWSRVDAPFPSMGWWLVAGLLVVGASVLGDLFESLLKRDAGVKDSGAILPGHGGVLDRVDALLPAAPLFYMALLGVSQ